MKLDNWLSNEDWLDELFKRIKQIEDNTRLDIWKRFRELGKLLEEVGSKHSLQARTTRKAILAFLGYKTDAIFTILRDLADKTDSELVTASNLFPSPFAFYKRLPYNTLQAIEYNKEKNQEKKQKAVQRRIEKQEAVEKEHDVEVIKASEQHDFDNFLELLDTRLYESYEFTDIEIQILRSIATTVNEKYGLMK